ncbi:MAG: NAD(+) kinase [Pseudomonadales bacterium]|jgi:NAD+ kinase
MQQFKKVGVVGRLEGNAQSIDTLKHLIDYLAGKGLEVVLEQHVSYVLPGHGLPVFSHEELGKQCDLAIVVGGDGSMLTTARALARHSVPVVGINRGGLGFLTDIAPDELEERLDDVFAGNFEVESRFMIEGDICRDGMCIRTGQALNDIVLSAGSSGRMIEFELYVDDHFVYSQRSNGLIISTPTGSTAYALSGGGPIVHPSLDAIVLVPMMPHTLTARPIVIDGNSHIKIIPGNLHDSHAMVCCDGHLNFTIEGDEEVSIRKMKDQLSLIHTLPNNYYATCRRKLGWGSRLTD